MVISLQANSFVEKLKSIAKTQKTVYAWGMFGAVITASRIAAKSEQYPAWYTEGRVEHVFEPLYGSKPPVWGFDCVGLVKGVLWGFSGDATKVYGGAAYASHGVPDLSADGMIGVCSGVSADFGRIAVGEFVWMPGHCGVYIGNGEVVEATPKWKNGVQIVALSARKWQKHGKLPYVVYGGEVSGTVTVELSVLRKGSRGDQVKTLQRLLNAFGASLDVDGDFGSKTDKALREYQKAKGLEVDGICGKNSWTSLLK